MKTEVIVCSKCKQHCRPMENGKPTWFGRYRNDKLIEAICIDCWEKGIRYSKDEDKMAVVA